jgi:hypothetical protein
LKLEHLPGIVDSSLSTGHCPNSEYGAVERGVDYSAEPATLVVFALVEVANGVMLTVTEAGFDRIPLARRARAFRANEEGWGMVAKLIEKYLADMPWLESHGGAEGLRATPRGPG